MMELIRPFILSFILIIVLGSILSLSDVSIALISKKLIDDAVSRNISEAIKVSLVFVGVIVMQIAFNSIISILASKLKELISNSIRSRIFERVLRAQWMELSKYHSGDLLTRMTRDVGIFSNAIVNTVPDMVSLGVQLVAAFIVLMFYEPMLAIIAVAIGPIAILTSRIFGRKIKKVHIRMQETEGEYRSFIQEIVQNLTVIKAFCLENRSLLKIDMLHNENFIWAKRRSRISTLTNSVLSLGYWIGYFISFGFGAFRLYQGRATFGTFTAFVQLFGQVQGPFEGLAYKIPQLISAGACAERLMEFEELDMEDEGKYVPSWENVGVLFENVIFKYDSEKPVLEDTSFEIYPGEIAALIGTSGEGKTTIVRLLLSLIKPEAGKIIITNKKRESIECCPSYRSMISYVPQGNTLFSGTIRDNLYLGNPDATDEELKKVLREASAWEFTNELTSGIDTEIGERGIGLSEGQAQRIAIARALLRKAPILLFDEATSALDVDTEINILRAIKNMKPQPTCIIITHRPSVMNMCNRVLKLEDGRIFECGEEVISNPRSEAI
jgi:ABC-type multidrug transport system fused ATPase/permease subunit